MKKAILATIIVIAVLGGLVAVLLLRPAESAIPVTQTMQTSTSVDSSANDGQSTASIAVGRYVDYDSSVVANTRYSETILFFHAAWCPECRAFEQAITAESIPDGVQIVKVDYDNSDELRQKYGVTLQSTFVKVTANGDRVSNWVGYGRDKSLSAVLENT